MATADNDILMLNGEFETVECYKNKARCSKVLDGNETYIAKGLKLGLLNHSIRFFPRSGDEQEMVKSTVSKHLSFIEVILFQVYNHNQYTDIVVTSGSLLATASAGSRSCLVYVWDMSSKKELYQLKHAYKVECVRFHSDTIITTCYGSIHIWKKSTGELLHSILDKNWCSNFDISPDGSMIAVVDYGAVSIWCLTNYNKIAELELDSVNAVHFQTNKKIIATIHSRTKRNGQVYVTTAY